MGLWAFITDVLFEFIGDGFGALMNGIGGFDSILNPILDMVREFIPFL